jgi:protein SCO1/2
VRPRTAALRWAVAAALLLSTAGATLIFARPERPQEVPAALRAVLVQEPAKLPALRLVDHRGAAVTSDALFTGAWSFVFLGFTSCPNVCPATLGQLAAVKRSLARQRPDLPQPRFVFVSVDPQRDTPARLASYLPAFDRDFLGATGEPAQIAALSDALAAFHRRRAEKGPDDYGVVHSGEIYLLDPTGRVYARFTPPLEPDLIPHQLAALMALYAGEPGRS